ncbi:MAG: hypothetical protein ACRCYU_09480 [Nocardioides sp.]
MAELVATESGADRRDNAVPVIRIPHCREQNGQWVSVGAARLTAAGVGSWAAFSVWAATPGAPRGVPGAAAPDSIKDIRT